MRPRARLKRAPLPKQCAVCGADLAQRGHRYCDVCRPVQNVETLSKANKVLRARRVAGSDPAHGGEATRRRSETVAASRRAMKEWERKSSEPADPRTFEREIMPRLASVSLAAIAWATGLSQPYCAMIRRGERIPHPRHWDGLRNLAPY